MRKVIAIDMDQVLADLLFHWVKVVNENENDNVSLEDITDWDMTKFFKCGKKIYDYLSHDLYRNLPVIEGSQTTVKKLMERYDVYIVTTATSYKESLLAKLEWLEEHFDFIPKDNIVLCGSKSIIKADYMIDDGIHNLEVFDGIGILFDTSYNRSEKRFSRVIDWNDVSDLLL